MKNAVFWDVTLCGSCKTDVSEELTASIYRVTRVGELGTALAITSSRSAHVFPLIGLQLLVTASDVPRLLILVALMMEVIISSQTSVLTRTKWSNTPEDGILQRRTLLKK
jgi:hypothetical protein